jgi:hypothetical protein
MFTTNVDVDRSRNYTISSNDLGMAPRPVSRADEDSEWQSGDEQSGEGVERINSK